MNLGLERAIISHLKYKRIWDVENDSRSNLRIIIQGPVKSKTPTFSLKVVLLPKDSQVFVLNWEGGMLYHCTFGSPKIAGLREDKKL